MKGYYRGSIKNTTIKLTTNLYLIEQRNVHKILNKVDLLDKLCMQLSIIL